MEAFELPQYSEKTLAICMILTSITSLSIGFVLGYWVSDRWNKTGKDGSKAYEDEDSTSDIFDARPTLQQK